MKDYKNFLKKLEELKPYIVEFEKNSCNRFNSVLTTRLNKEKMLSIKKKRLTQKINTGQKTMERYSIDKT